MKMPRSSSFTTPSHSLSLHPSPPPSIPHPSILHLLAFGSKTRRSLNARESGSQRSMVGSLCVPRPMVVCRSSILLPRCLSHEFPRLRRFYRSGFRDAPAFRFRCQHMSSTPPGRSLSASARYTNYGSHVHNTTSVLCQGTSDLQLPVHPLLFQ